MFWRRHHEANDSVQRDAKVKELRIALGLLSDRSLRYCTDACLVRYLEARNWNVDKAKKMLEETLKWRATYKPDEIQYNEVAFEGETGKLFRASFHDRLGRPVLIMRPGKQNSSSSEGNIRHLVYMLENAVLNLPQKQEQMVWLIDFSGWSMSSTPMKTSLETINVLQNHYPERLAIAFLYNPPRIFETFWRAVKYFLDAKTFQKVQFVHPNKEESVKIMRSHFDIENLPSDFGGNATLEYDHQKSSRLMFEDDVKSAKFWGLDNKETETEPALLDNKHSRAEVAPEPVSSLA
ncbi:hypothetical protein V2J09_021877 [Rumex salicifolius]